jgi:hypothetical protein
LPEVSALHKAATACPTLCAADIVLVVAGCFFRAQTFKPILHILRTITLVTEQAGHSPLITNRWKIPTSIKDDKKESASQRYRHEGGKLNAHCSGEDLTGEQEDHDPQEAHYYGLPDQNRFRRAI